MIPEEGIVTDAAHSEKNRVTEYQGRRRIEKSSGSNPPKPAMSKRYSEDLSMSYLNLIGYWTGHP